MCPLDNTLDININNLTLTQPVQLSILLKQVNQMKNPDFFCFLSLFIYLPTSYTCTTLLVILIFPKRIHSTEILFLKTSQQKEGF